MAKLYLIPDNAIQKECKVCGRLIYLFENEFDEWKPFEAHPDHAGKAAPHITVYVRKKRYCQPIKRQQKTGTPLFG